MRQTDPVPPPATLVIFGASGATGRAAVLDAAARGYRVRAIDHSGGESWPEGVEEIVADVLEDDLRGIVRGADAVLSCLGVGNDLATLASPPPLYTDGTGRIAEAMAAEGVARLVVISASFVATRDRGPLLFRLGAEPALARVFAQMAEMEEMLAGTRLAWTAVRPGWLMEGPATGDVLIREDEIASDTIRTRHADLAAFMLDCVASGDWARSTPAISRPEAPEHESNAAVAEAMLA